MVSDLKRGPSRTGESNLFVSLRLWITGVLVVPGFFFPVNEEKKKREKKKGEERERKQECGKVKECPPYWREENVP